MILLLIWLVLLAAPAFGQQSAVLSWNANSELDLAGYKVYYGYFNCATMGTLRPVVTLSKVTTYTITGVPDGTTMLSARITAYDTANNESAKSNCVEKTFASIPTPEPPPVDPMDALDLRVQALENKLDALRANWCALRGKDVTQDVRSERAALGGC